jgi:tetratricopeptide (TPR) repeat protein
MAVLALSQALWFSVPLALRDWRVDAGIDPLRGDVRGYYFYWIALAHSAQYLWVTSYYARASRRWHGHVHYLAKTLMAGAAVWTLPIVVFAPDALGSLSYDAGLALLVSAAVNVHHFILDGAIWKLRSSRIASVLIRSVPEEPGGALEPERRAWLRPAVWATAGFAACVAVFVLWQEYFVFEGALERKDPAAAEAALDRLAWFGRDDWIHRVRLGHSLSEAGEDEAAMEAYRRSLELQESPAAYAALGWLHKKRGDLAQAEELLLSALELAPRHPKLLRHAAEFSLERGELKGAEEYLARLEALEGSDDETVRRLRRAQRRLEQAPIASY